MSIQIRWAALALLALTLSACGVDETTAPPLAGPSEFALGITVHATPDSILQDGVSKSTIEIDARGPDGQPARNVSLRLAVAVEGAVQDFGTLSTKTTTTDGNGTARVTYTAPPKPAESVGAGTMVTIVVTPIGGDYRAETNRQVDIRLIPPGVIIPPNGEPVPAFTMSPSTASTFTPVMFDATSTADEGVVCGGRCAYSWSFGDGGSANGMVVSHEFRLAGTFAVTLTVSDNRGQQAMVTQSISVGASSVPTASFVFSPSTPLPGQMIFFNASSSTPSVGRQIVSYEWDFGSGRTAQGMTTSKTYDTAGSYVVTLKVTDDAGQAGTSSQTVSVGGGSAQAPTATFVYSPTNPAPAQPVNFNAGGSTAGPGRRIVSYRWNFGDGSSADGVTPSKAYAAVGSYVAALTVTDDQGAVGTTSQSISVTATPPIPAFTVSPQNPAVGQAVFFNATGSTAGPGQQVVSYSWNFGDGSPDGNGPTTSKTYAVAGSYVVTLTVTDDRGLKATTTATVSVAGAPTAAFLFSPTDPKAGVTRVFFNASTSRPSPGRQIVSYQWDFGDGSVASGITEDHIYGAPGAFVVILTVTDDRNSVSRVSQQVTVAP